MINLDKLNQINDSLSTEENDKKLLIEYYKQALEEINKLELANNKLTEYSETLNETAQLLRQIYTKCGYTTKLKKPFNSSNNIKEIIHIRKRNLQRSLDKIEYKIKYYGNIENIDIKELLKNLHSSLEFLNQDITEIDNQKSKIYNNTTLGTLTHFGTSHNGYNILLFDNVDFPDHVNYCYDILENKDVKKITKTIYPKLIDDFIEHMDKIYTEKQEIREIISNYTRFVHRIRRISNKYHVIFFD
jgi:hypothetical protein